MNGYQIPTAGHLGDTVCCRRGPDSHFICVHNPATAFRGGTNKLHPTPSPFPSLWGLCCLRHVYWRKMNYRCKLQLLSQTVHQLTPVTIKGGFTNGICNGFHGLVLQRFSMKQKSPSHNPPFHQRSLLV